MFVAMIALRNHQQRFNAAVMLTCECFDPLANAGRSKGPLHMDVSIQASKTLVTAGRNEICTITTVGVGTIRLAQKTPRGPLN